MTERVLVWAGALALVLVAAAVMAGLHERHYRSRAARIAETRDNGIEARIATIETILAEDRLT